MTLRYVIDQGGPIPVLAGLRLAGQLCQGLQAIHGERLLHRGLKPENVIVEATGQARWMDPGLSLPIASGGTVGRLEYLAPEQLEGHESDARVDVYGLGAVLYETFTAQVPVSGSDPEEIRRKLLTEDPAPPSTLVDMPAELERILMRCLAKRPEERYASPAEVFAELDSVPA